jgi:predicted DNA-binding transcriptional regulator AlpA
MDEFKDFNVEELCKILDKSKTTLYNWRKKKIGPRFYYDESGKVQYPLTELRKWKQQKMAMVWDDKEAI